MHVDFMGLYIQFDLLKMLSAKEYIQQSLHPRQTLTKKHKFLGLSGSKALSSLVFIKCVKFLQMIVW